MPPKNVEDVVPLSPMQSLMLLHEVGAPGRSVLVNQTCYAVRGPLDRAAFEEAVSRLVARHPALRTCFVWEGLDEPLQVVRTEVSPVVDWVDLVDLPPVDREAEAEVIRVADAARAFDIRRAPLVRFTVVRTETERALLFCTVHHLVADRWSFTHLMVELGHLYRSIAAGEPTALEPAPRFRDYIAWLQARDPGESDRFWRERLAGLRQPSRLSPGGAPGRHAADVERTTTVRTLDPSLHDELAARAADARLGRVAFVLAALALETARRSRTRDVAFGLTVAGRPPDLDGVETMVGSFVNNVPATFRVDPDDSIGSWLRTIQLDQVRRQPHEHVSLARLHGLSSLPDHEPLFDLLVVLNLDDVENADFGPVALDPQRATLAGGYPLVLQIAQADGALGLTLVHALAEADAEALLDDIARAVTSVVRADDTSTLVRIVDLDGLRSAPAAADPAADPDLETASTPDEAPRGAGQAVRAAWSEVLGISTADPDDDFFALGGTSLQGVRLLARIERELGVRVPIATLVAGRTLGALLEGIETPVGDVGPLVVIRAEGAAAPLIAVPGVKGNVLLYPQLAEQLKAGRPVFGLQSRGVDDDAPLLGTMRDIAEDFADQLEPFLGRPFHLFGLCWGAAAAFEVTAVLESRGTPPTSVGLLDPTALGVRVGADGRSTTGGRVGFVLDRLSMYWDEFQTLDWAGRREMVANKTSRVADAVRGRAPEGTRQEMRARAVVEANLRALAEYRPSSVKTPARLFLAEAYEPDYGRDHRLEWFDHFDPAASRVIVPGFDSGDVINTHTEALAEAVDRWLAEVERNG